MALTPWSYRAGNSPLHRLPAALKLVLLIVLASAPLWGLPFMAATALVILSGSLLAGIRPWELFAGSRPLALMLFAAALVRGLSGTARTYLPLWKSGVIIPVDAENVKESLLFAGGILLSFAACSLLFSVTTTMELRRSLEQIELFLCRRKKHGKISLALALMLGFLPSFFERWEGAKLAVRARGGSIRGLAGLRLFKTILSLAGEGMIETAAETALALEARGLEL